ncbi:hypothetical protein HN937_05235 [Candidatus Poribacteria bacterium]|nr:hypothetical protein [Candidatus Poribacteria bacterium]
MRYVHEEGTLQAALARRLLGVPPGAGDASAIAHEVSEVIAKQAPDGAFGESPSDTAKALCRLFELGCAPDMPEVVQGLDALPRQHRAEGTPDPADGDNLKDPVHAHGREGSLANEAIDALTLGGRHSVPELRPSLRHMAGHVETWLRTTGCPWGPNWYTQTLWNARHVEDVEATVLLSLRWFARHMDDAGLVGYMDPWGHVKTAGVVDHPLGANQARRMLPLVLRTQRPDGGWGDNTVDVIRMLTTHGLLDRMRDLPPLPDDWTVERSVPAPSGEFGHMTWHDGHMWAHDTKANEVVGMSSDDGAVTRRIPLPVDKVYGIAWHDGLLAVCQGGPWEPNKNLFLIDPDTGAVRREVALDKVDMAIGLAELGGRLWIGDGFAFGAKLLDPARPEEITHVQWPGTCAGYMASTGDTVWHTDSFAKVMVECDRVGELTDWAEIPFDGAVKGLAHDGNALWALDGSQRRLCQIRRAA